MQIPNCRRRKNPHGRKRWRKYLLNDNNQMADEAEKIIRENAALVTIEIIAEVVYVLKKVYTIERGIIKSSEYLKFIEKTDCIV